MFPIDPKRYMLLFRSNLIKKLQSVCDQIVSVDHHIFLSGVYILFLYFMSFEGVSSARNNSLLSRSLRSEVFRDSVLICIGVFVSLFLHTALDSINRMSKIFILTRWIPLFMFVVPQLVFLSDVCVTGDLDSYWRLVYIQGILFISSSFYFMQNQCSDIFTSGKVITCHGLICLSFVLRLVEGHLLYFKNILGIISFSALILSTVLFLRIYYLWHKKYIYGRSFLYFSDDIKLCYAYMITLLGIHLGWIFAIFFYQNVPKDDIGIVPITVYNYYGAILLLLFSALHGQRLRNDVLRTQVIRIISKSNYLINYFCLFIIRIH